jgi:hypothetical protein
MGSPMPPMISTLHRPCTSTQAVRLTVHVRRLYVMGIVLGLPYRVGRCGGRVGMADQRPGRLVQRSPPKICAGSARNPRVPGWQSEARRVSPSANAEHGQSRTRMRSDSGQRKWSALHPRVAMAQRRSSGPDNPLAMGLEASQLSIWDTCRAWRIPQVVVHHGPGRSRLPQPDSVVAVRAIHAPMNTGSERGRESDVSQAYAEGDTPARRPHSRGPDG